VPAFQGLSIFHIPADTPGLTVGRNTELIGWPLTHHAELILDDVRLPADALVGPENGAAMVFAGHSGDGHLPRRLFRRSRARGL
jgi:alkylation response protein AidB-like acyl-CoA dehydrogenase